MHTVPSLGHVHNEAAYTLVWREFSFIVLNVLAPNVQTP